MTRRLFEEDLRSLVGEKRSGRSTMYFGAMSFIALHLRSSVLNAIRCFIGSQCNWRRTGVISSVRVLGTPGEQSSFEHTVVYWEPIVVTLAYRRELQKSSLDEIKAWTSISASFWGRQFRILAIVRYWKSNVTPILGHWIDIYPVDGVILHFNN